MSSNTDYFAQVANGIDDPDDVDFSDYEKMKSKDKAKIPSTLLNMDLALHSDSILAGSIASICAGIVGGENAKNPEKDLRAHVKFLKAEMLLELSEIVHEMVTEQVEEKLADILRKRTSMDDLRDKVVGFSLLKSEVRNHDNEQAEEQRSFAERGLI